MIRNIKIIITITILAIGQSILYSQSETPVIIFFIGDVSVIEILSKKSVKAYAGLSLTEKNIIKTGKNSIAQIQSGNTAYIIKENTYASFDIIKKMEQDKSSYGIMAIFDKSRTNGKTIIASTRAAEKNDSIKWADDTVSEDKPDISTGLFEDLSTLAAASEHQKLISLYEKSIEKNIEKKGSFTIKCEYLAAVSYLNLCQYRKAGTLFDSVSKSEDTVLKPEALFNSGLSSYCLLDYNKTFSTLNKYIKQYPTGGSAAEAYFLLAKCSLMTNNINAAVSDFKIVMEKFKGDPMSAYAEEEYKKINK